MVRRRKMLRQLLHQQLRLLFVVTLFCFVWKTEPSTAASWEEETEAIEDKLDHITEGIEELDRRMDSRLNRKTSKDVRLLQHRVTKLEECTCSETEFQCGGHHPQCVSKIFVCDSVKDCRNGQDELNCEIPFKEKDVYEGTEIYDDCILRRPGKMTVVIKEIRNSGVFRTNPTVRVVIIINYEDEVISGALALPSRGQYSFADRRLVISPPLPHVRGLICKFDGVRDDFFVGDVIDTGSEGTCATFSFKRK